MTRKIYIISYSFYHSYSRLLLLLLTPRFVDFISLFVTFSSILINIIPLWQQLGNLEQHGESTFQQVREIIHLHSPKKWKLFIFLIFTSTKAILPSPCLLCYPFAVAGGSLGLWMFARSLYSCVDQILTLDGSILQKELANMLVFSSQLLTLDECFWFVQ